MTTVHPNVSDLVEDLIERLRASGCVVSQIGPRAVEVRSGWPVGDDTAMYELDGFLRVFEATRVAARREIRGKGRR